MAELCSRVISFSLTMSVCVKQKAEIAIGCVRAKGQPHAEFQKGVKSVASFLGHNINKRESMAVSRRTNICIPYFVIGIPLPSTSF